MPDVYAAITTADHSVLEDLARILELRAADPQQITMRTSYQADIELRAGAKLLEVGCGTGPVCRALAQLRGDCHVVGLDPSPFFLERARVLAVGMPNLEFQQGDTRQLPYDAAAFDVLVFHTTLCHVPEVDRALVEARRVLRPGGQLVVFDADYSSTSVAAASVDPLQACAAATVAAIVHDPHLVQKLVPRVRRAGFSIRSFRTYDYQGVTDAAYMLTIIDRGANALVNTGVIGSELATALQAEARRRVQAGSFFGHLSYASLVAVRS